MASLDFDSTSKRWRIRFYYAGKQYKRSIKTMDQRAAESARKRVEDTIMFLEQGRLVMPPDADPAQFILSDGKLTAKPVAKKIMTLGDLFSTYREKLTEGAKERNTRRVEDIHANHLERVLGKNKVLASIRTADLQQYVDRRSRETWRKKPIKPQTVRKEIDTLQTIWNWAGRLEYATGAAPTHGLVYPRDKEKSPFQTSAEIERIIGRGGLAADAQKDLWHSLFLNTAEVADVLQYVQEHTKTPWLFPMFVFAAHTGARKSEMLRSQVEDFNFEAGWVRIREKKRKKGKETTRNVELSPMLADVMRDYLRSAHPGGQRTLCRRPDEPLLESTVHEAFRWVLLSGKWKVLRGFHIFRHSFASNLAAAGIDQRIIDEFMGHQTDAMRRRYRHLFPEQRRMAILSVFAQKDPTHASDLPASAGAILPAGTVATLRG